MQRLHATDLHSSARDPQFYNYSRYTMDLLSGSLPGRRCIWLRISSSLGVRLWGAGEHHTLQVPRGRWSQRRKPRELRTLQDEQEIGDNYKRILSKAWDRNHDGRNLVYPKPS
jgi:hypothetical protein